MPFDFVTILLCGVPGLGIELIGMALVLVRWLRGRRRSPMGLRLITAGFGLFVLGIAAATVVDFVLAGKPLVALAVAAVFGWQPLLFFWLATRPRITDEEPRPEWR